MLIFTDNPDSPEKGYIFDSLGWMLPFERRFAQANSISEWCVPRSLVSGPNCNV